MHCQNPCHFHSDTAGCTCDQGSCHPKVSFLAPNVSSVNHHFSRRWKTNAWDNKASTAALSPIGLTEAKRRAIRRRDGACFSASLSISPVAGRPAKVSYSDHLNVVEFDAVDDPEGKPVHQASPRVFRHGRPSLGELDDTRNCRVDFLCEFHPETCSTLLIVVDCLVELRFSVFVEVEFHLPCFVRIFEKTSSPGTSLASPASSWVTRRSASSAQRRSISLSIGRLRLVRSFSTRSKRASAGSERASSVTRSVTASTVHLHRNHFGNIELSSITSEQILTFMSEPKANLHSRRSSCRLSEFHSQP